MSRLSKRKTREVFQDLLNRMRVSTNPEEVKGLVGFGQSVVEQAHGPARDLARKLQEKLAKVGEKKQNEVLTVKKGMGVEGTVGGTGGSFSRFRERLPPQYDYSKVNGPRSKKRKEKEV